ncbi:flavodoxin-dependent (E)-4-hydroxy-3-methylbut-2-enyl-diphosphate synthase [Candidatus Sumerlaeota bacterium]|nr:flavodoxin-dependent (E)-4-hydroxy-3-methylbut-2-enyl-diphosphate synthase [Candidatus Sumerlaeota bacterium]
MRRRATRQVRVGEVAVGGGSPITVQTMTKTHTHDARATLAQIEECAAAGCNLIRVAAPTADDAQALNEIVPRSPLPIIADIHFDHRLALAALEAGVQGLRLNPGNLRGRDKIELIAREASKRGIPIRVGANAGSLAPQLRKRVEAGLTTVAEAMVESVLEEIRLLEESGFREIKVSLKASDAPTTVEAYRLLAPRCDYPFHVGVTEAGPGLRGAVKSALGIGVLLFEGLVDTLRVSLTASPEEEVRVGRLLLQAAGLMTDMPDLVSCPTCGRLEVDLAPVADEIERFMERKRIAIKVAVMGCSVNGPGEAREADVGLAAGKGFALIFRRGRVVRRVAADQMLDALKEEIERFEKDSHKGQFVVPPSGGPRKKTH